MSYSIVFSSRTGNTRQLAETIRETLGEEGLVYFGAPDEAALQADRLYVGFWTDKGSCNQEAADFLKTLSGKEVFLFGTAGFGGVASYFDKILEKARKALPRDVRVLGTYMCQGKMPMSVRERYVKMKESPVPVPRMDQMIENFDKALSHPDAADLEGLAGAVRSAG